MIFNTHDRTPKIKTSKPVKIMFISLYSFWGAFFLFIAIATSVTSHSLLPALIFPAIFAFCASLIIVPIVDMNKAYIQIDGDSITVVDYYLFIRKEKHFSFDEIKTAKITLGFSHATRGYRYSMVGFTYIVFRNDSNKYLFKILNCPETKEFFSKYLDIQDL